MKPLDYLLALLSLVGLAVFLGILMWRVPAPALITVCVLGIAMAAYDFFVESRKRSDGN